MSDEKKPKLIVKQPGKEVRISQNGSMSLASAAKKAPAKKAALQKVGAKKTK